MISLLKRYIVLVSVMGTLALVIMACANMASPSGGPVDLDPPRVVSSSPGFNATRVEKGKITIIFDENVTVKNPSENVIITPPQQAFPIIQAANRKLTVEIRDTLLANTTYTIDFTDAVVDNNEENPLENFSFSFSTGDVVDSLAISGKVLTASNLEPIKGIYVGLHANLDDSAFTKVRFDRISRTNESGEFTIRGVAPGRYRLYALDDKNRDYKYDNPAEAIAFFESVIEPNSERSLRMDTVFRTIPAKGNLPEERVIDTIQEVHYTRFLPDNIVMRAFTSEFRRMFLQNTEWKGKQLFVYFGGPNKLPEIEPLNFQSNDDWYVLERYPKNDTLIYWIKDTTLLKMDTLSVRMDYLKMDSLNQIIPATDTINFVDRTRKRKPEKEEKKKEKKEDGEEEAIPITFLQLNTNLTGTWDTQDAIQLEFNEPLVGSPQDKIIIQQKRDSDSTYTDIPYQLVPDSVNPRKFTIRNKWVYDGEYQFRIDSASIYSIYGLWNNTIQQPFKVKAEEKYGQLAIRVGGVDGIPSFIELLDKSDKPIRKARVIDNVAVFRDVNPGTYYARIILDENNNGIWDTGDYDKKRQPEMVCYSSKVYEIKEFWIHDEADEPWIIDVNNLAKQKPLDITKQKPKDKETRRKQLEKKDAESRQRNSRNNTNDPNNPNRNQQYNTNDSYNTNRTNQGY